jgi:hypothetical protein
MSQAGTGDAIRQCASLDDKDARIACLEDALRRADDAGDTMPQAADPVPGTPESQPAPQGTRTQPRQEAVTVSAPENAAGTGTSQSADSLGAEQVINRDRRDDEDDQLEATVVAFDFVRYQRLRVQLDNGQVWRQVDGDRVDVTRELHADSKFDVELWKTGLGGYRMRIVALDRTLRVQRLK